MEELFFEVPYSRNAINILLGAGLLFFGIGMLKSGTAPLRDILIQDGVLAFVASSIWLLALFGGVLTILCQSSSVAGAIAVAATTIGLLDFGSACWVVFGANLGAAVNQYLLARVHSGELRQISLMQVLQKLFGFLAVLVLLAIGTFWGQPPIERAASAMAGTVAGQVAWVFLAYQVVGALVCTVAFEPILSILRRLAPSSPLQEMSKPAFLLDESLVDPSLALDLAIREEARLIERLPMMLDGIRSDAPLDHTPSGLLRSASHAITDAIGQYLKEIMDQNVERPDRDRIIRLQHRIANLVALFDGLEEFSLAIGDAKRWPASAAVSEPMVEALHALMSALADATKSDDSTDREIVLSLLGHRDEMMERMRRRVLRENPDLPAKAQEAVFSATTLFERIVWLARRGTLLLAPQEGAAAQ
jgi:phosphate:Na+ symporter